MLTLSPSSYSDLGASTAIWRSSRSALASPVLISSTANSIVERMARPENSAIRCSRKAGGFASVESADASWPITLRSRCFDAGAKRRAQGRNGGYRTSAKLLLPATRRQLRSQRIRPQHRDGLS